MVRWWRQRSGASSVVEWSEVVSLGRFFEARAGEAGGPRARRCQSGGHRRLGPGTAGPTWQRGRAVLRKPWGWRGGSELRTVECGWRSMRLRERGVVTVTLPCGPRMGLGVEAEASDTPMWAPDGLGEEAEASWLALPFVQPRRPRLTSRWVRATRGRRHSSCTVDDVRAPCRRGPRDSEDRTWTWRQLGRPRRPRWRQRAVGPGPLGGAAGPSGGKASHFDSCWVGAPKQRGPR